MPDAGPRRAGRLNVQAFKPPSSRHHARSMSAATAKTYLFSHWSWPVLVTDPHTAAAPRARVKGMPPPPLPDTPLAHELAHPRMRLQLVQPLVELAICFAASAVVVLAVLQALHIQFPVCAALKITFACSVGVLATGWAITLALCARIDIDEMSMGHDVECGVDSTEKNEIGDAKGVV